MCNEIFLGDKLVQCGLNLQTVSLPPLSGTDVKCDTAAPLLVRSWTRIQGSESQMFAENSCITYINP
jgi:hypothetical protein